MEIRICSVKRLYALAADGGLSGAGALISSSQPVDPIRLRGIPYAACQYDDVDRELPGRSFPEEDARCFAAFLKGLDHRTQVLYCCCDGGCRRSAAVACAATVFFGGDDMPLWLDPAYEPNALVYEKLCRALGIPLSDPELDLRIESSRQALRRAIRCSGRRSDIS